MQSIKTLLPLMTKSELSNNIHLGFLVFIMTHGTLFAEMWLLIMQDSYILVTKDTILRSTINDYFENEPVGRLTAWVYPPRYEKRYPWSKTLPLEQIYLPQILK